MPQSTFKRKAHAAYFSRCITALPAQAQEHDSNRVTIAFFCLAGLDLLGELKPGKDRDGWIEWLWSLQAPTGGFAGSPSATPHLPSTYTALAALSVLRADLTPLRRSELARFVRACQNADGSFSPTERLGGVFQNDARMSYCASIVRAVFRGSRPGANGSERGLEEGEEVFDVVKAREYVGRCKTWDGGYAARPGLEAQGGTTYCATAALALLDAEPQDAGDTLRWLTQRQIGGFQGRPGKLEDVCYSFWCGGALANLGHASLVNSPANTAFLLDAQSPIGGFGKEPEDFPDPFHSYLALAALALTPARDELGIKEIDPVWNLTPVARDWLLGSNHDQGQEP